VHIFFGSQTGTAANFAKTLGQEAEKAGFDPKVGDLVDWTPESFKKVKVAIFTMATHGEGEPTDNAKKFYEYLTDTEKGNTEFPNLRFSVFGLGNKQYQFYNAMGKRTDQNLERLGAQR
jgi:NADPH-ferrihemoprotein reductase